MNLILLSKDDFIDPKKSFVRLMTRRHEHIRDVLKASEGDELCAGELNGLIGTGRISKIGPDYTEMEVTLKERPPAPLSITLVIALPRPIVFKRLIGHAASMGIKKIMVVNSLRVEKSYWKSPALAKKTIDEKLMLGLEQAKDTVMPDVSFHKNFASFIEKEFPAAMKGTRGLLAHCDAAQVCPCSITEPVTLVIGPEGGFIDSEAGKLKAAGCEPVTLGKRILRVEEAAIAFIARLMI